MEETSEIPIDDPFRIELLGEMLTGIARTRGKEPLVFVDNLDQITEVESVSEFLRLLLNLDETPVVVTIRSEFVSADIHREHRTPISIGPLQSKELIAILERRIELCREGEELRGAGILNMARELSGVTGNPLAFLTWIDYLCWFTPLRKGDYLIDLKGYVHARHEFIEDEVLKVAAWYFQTGMKPTRRGKLMEELSLDKDDLDTLERQGIIAPDDITRPSEARRYSLDPRLAFLKLAMKS